MLWERRTPAPAWKAGSLLLLASVGLAGKAEAHVKWFSEFSFGDRPLTLSEAVTPTFIGLALLSIVVIGALVPLDRFLGRMAGYRRINDWLTDRRENSVTVMRVATAAVMLLSWQANSLLAPHLPIEQAWLGWAQFAVAFLLLFQRTVPLAGLGLIGLYGIGLAQFGAFYMLDYLVYAGAGVFLLVSNASDRRIKGLGVPAIYLTLGLSLCWVALEKIIYPQWGQYVLQQNPQLALGLPIDFFLVGAAFVEFSLGYLLIIGLLERPLALTVTIVFFTTTLVFGKLEVIGHTLLHGALIVFLLEGPGRVYPPPVKIHKRMGLRIAFASVNFALLLVLLMVPYTYAARRLYEQRGGQATSEQARTEEAAVLAP